MDKKLRLKSHNGVIVYGTTTTNTNWEYENTVTASATMQLREAFEMEDNTCCQIITRQIFVCFPETVFPVYM